MLDKQRVERVFLVQLKMKAVPKQRPRTRRDSSVQFTPAATRKFEKMVKTKASTLNFTPYTCPVMVNVAIIEPVPQSFSKVKTEAALAGYITPQVGDTDNKFKAITDALNGVAYIDDKQVSSFHVHRRYGRTATGEIIVHVSRIGLSVDELEKALQD